MSFTKQTIRGVSWIVGLAGLLAGFPDESRAGGDPGPRAGLGAQVIPGELSPGDAAIVKLRVANRSPVPLALAIAGRVVFEGTPIAELALGPFVLEPGVERAFDHPLEIPSDAPFGVYSVAAVLADASSGDPLAEAAARFGVAPRSPIRLGLEANPNHTHPGGAILLRIGLQNRTEEPLQILVGGRVLHEGRRVGPIPPRGIQLRPRETVGVRIPVPVPTDAVPGPYAVQVVAGPDLREPVAAGHVPFAVVPPAPVQVGAAVRPEVVRPGDGVRLTSRVENRLEQEVTVLSWGFLRNESAPVQFFGPRPVRVPAGEAAIQTVPFPLPETLPPGRYRFEVWVGPGPGRAFDHSVADFVVRPVEGE